MKVSSKEACGTGRCAIREGLTAISLKGYTLVVGIFLTFYSRKVVDFSNLAIFLSSFLSCGLPRKE
jgi:hypothetical protein